MNHLLIISMLALFTSVALAQDSGPPPPPEDYGDWAWFYGTDIAIATQASHDEISSGWHCPGNQPVIDHIWKRLDFTLSWVLAANSGVEDPCNSKYPIGRMLNAAVLMGYSGANPPSCNTKNRNILDWALCFATSRIDEMSTSCYPHSNAFATTYSDPFGSNMYMWPNGIYSQDILGLASTILHEARHWDCGHNGDDGACPRGRSCDETWRDGCPWPSNAHGANRFQVVWLAWYANSGMRGTQDLKERAAVRGGVILAGAFVKNPCFTLANDGTPMDIQVPGCM